VFVKKHNIFGKTKLLHLNILSLKTADVLCHITRKKLKPFTQ